ncbi:C39 family peptidase [Bacillus sp. EB600]|uniref:C39 family peptidase n=1 Tax=Bacillus sp. EB600 TaxID=2806345 RepID=UPI00210AD137|nr:C39 family peptidase [Bacillus sp. EB600]MCQ6281507.1 C39 family peptidase [Bacillus sp. EB600]
MAVLIFLTENFLTIHKQARKSSAIRKSNSLSQLETALVEKQPILLESKLLDIPLINQLDPPGLYNGCEVTSLAMILNYNGYTVTKNELASKIKTVPLNYKNGLKGNPNEGFVGDMVDGPGYGAYNGPIYDLAKEYAGDNVVNLTSSPFTDLLKQVSGGQPVWVITTTSFSPVSGFEKWSTPQGTIEITFSEHSAVITGYDENFIYVNDPYGHKNRKLDRDNFEKAWEQMGSQAIVIEEEPSNA